MTSVYPVIPKRSEESHKSLLPKNLRFRNSAFQSYYQQVDSMTVKCKDVIGNPLIKEDLYLNGNDITKSVILAYARIHLAFLSLVIYH